MYHEEIAASKRKMVSVGFAWLQLGGKYSYRAFQVLEGLVITSMTIRERTPPADNPARQIF